MLFCQGICSALKKFFKAKQQTAITRCLLLANLYFAPHIYGAGRGRLTTLEMKFCVVAQNGHCQQVKQFFAACERFTEGRGRTKSPRRSPQGAKSPRIGYS